MTHDPKLQAFLEDLVAVFARHGMKLSGMEAPSVYPLTADDCFASFIEGGEDLCFDNNDQTGNVYYPRCASAPIPTTAHARLSAAARVACLADQDGQIADTVESIAEMLDRAAEVGEFGPNVSDSMPLEGLCGSIGSPCSHAEFRDLMRPIIDAMRNGRVAP